MLLSRFNQFSCVTKQIVEGCHILKMFVFISLLSSDLLAEHFIFVLSQLIGDLPEFLYTTYLYTLYVSWQCFHKKKFQCFYLSIDKFTCFWASHSYCCASFQRFFFLLRWHWEQQC